EIAFHKHGFPMPEVSARHFALNVTPAVNLFPVEADAINLNHEISEHLIVPHGAQRQHYQIYSIESVSGYVQGGAEPKRYVPFSLLTYSSQEAQASYRTSMRPATVGNTIDTYLSVVYEPGDTPTNETLSLRLTCTNRALPEQLKLGDVSHATSTSPERFAFRNITPITAAIEIGRAHV